MVPVGSSDISVLDDISNDVLLSLVNSHNSIYRSIYQLLEASSNDILIDVLALNNMYTSKIHNSSLDEQCLLYKLSLLLIPTICLLEQRLVNINLKPSILSLSLL